VQLCYLTLPIGLKHSATESTQSNENIKKMGKPLWCRAIRLLENGCGIVDCGIVGVWKSQGQGGYRRDRVCPVPTVATTIAITIATITAIAIAIFISTTSPIPLPSPLPIPSVLQNRQSPTISPPPIIMVVYRRNILRLYVYRRNILRPYALAPTLQPLTYFTNNM